jgi:SAM-dependent methyltransferase
MASDKPRLFWEIHSGLPREGPGDNDSTRRALAMVHGLPARPRILDVACGPGMQTLALAQASAGTIVALDTHRPFLTEAARRAAAAGLTARIAAVNASMRAMPFADGGFDLIWCEGAARSARRAGQAPPLRRGRGRRRPYSACALASARRRPRATMRLRSSG